MTQYPLSIEIDGEGALQQAMLEFDRTFRKSDMNRAARRAMLRACDAGKKLTPPGDKAREIVKRTGPLRKKDVSKRTDTVRYANHFVKIYRQGKKPIFVPITLNPYAEITQDGIAPKKGTPNYAAYDTARKRKLKGRGVPFLTYQQRRKSTRKGGKNVSKYDTAAEIRALRKIGRRGAAGQVWAWLGKKSYAQKAKPYKKTVRQDFVSKWSRFKSSLRAFSTEVEAENKLTYQKKAYGNIEPHIKAKAAEFLRKEVLAKLERRAEKAQQKAG